MNLRYNDVMINYIPFVQIRINLHLYKWFQILSNIFDDCILVVIYQRVIE